jgi:hypothetical protein
MLFAITGVQRCPVEGIDGGVGTVKDFLFDDQSWKIRWMVVDRLLAAGAPHIDPPVGDCSAGPGRIDKTRIADDELGRDTGRVRPSNQTADRGKPGGARRRAGDEADGGPALRLLWWDPSSGTAYFGPNAIVTSPAGPPIFAEAAARQAARMVARPDDGDPHLRSVVSVNGYYIHATDGDLGHVENFLADDANWDIRYLVIATRDWWPGKHVRLAPYAVKEIDWSEERINVNVTSDQVKSSPPWDPLAMADHISEQQLHRHFGWPGYGW